MKTGVDCIGISTSFYCHDEAGLWLLHKRSDKCRDERGVWDSGGGKLEFGLSPEENVLKEIREEYGITPRIEKQLPAITLLRTDPHGLPTHWIVIPFILSVPNEEKKNVIIGDRDKIDTLGWFPFSALPHPLHPGFLKTVALNKPFFKSY